jgi:hypothetical protein
MFPQQPIQKRISMGETMDDGSKTDNFSVRVCAAKHFQRAAFSIFDPMNLTSVRIAKPNGP